MTALDKFFKLQEKATGGDPLRMASFNYYMMWIIFLAFFSMLVGNLYEFTQTWHYSKLGWAAVMFGIIWFQFGSLKMMYDNKKTQEKIATNTLPKLEIDSVKKMMEGFTDGNIKPTEPKTPKS